MNFPDGSLKARKKHLGSKDKDGYLIKVTVLMWV